jgi:signal peptidase I
MNSNERPKVEYLGVFGDSMFPTLKFGERVKFIPIRHCTYNDVKVGEIVSYWSSGFNRDGKPRFWHRANVVHRVVWKTSAFALIKGDNRDYIEKVLYDKINGKISP